MKIIKSKKPPLTPIEFERIFRIIHGVLLNEKGDPTHACLYFGIIGAHILKAHHKLDSKIVAGAAAYNFLKYKKNNQGKYKIGFFNPALKPLSSNEDSFHCWVEVDGWSIDFSSPLFSELINPNDSPNKIPRLLIQKPLNNATENFNEIEKTNTYWYQKNIELGNRLIDDFMSYPMNIDLIEICVK